MQNNIHGATDYRYKVSLNAWVQFFLSSWFLQLCMTKDNVTFGLLKEENENLSSSGIFDVEQNRRIGFFKNNFQWCKD